jgi:arginase
MIRAQGMARALVPAIEALRAKVKSVYLHVDMDVLDPQVARANAYAEPDGLSVAEVETAWLPQLLKPQ